MHLDWLETFLAVVDRGGFTAASEHLHRAQSRVSAHIAALERDLGVRLFDRTRRPTALTPAGEVFVEHARGMVTGIATARSAVGAVREFEREGLTLVATPCVGAALFPGVLARLTAELPGLRIDLAERSWREAERRSVADGAAIAVLPVLAEAPAGRLRHRLLWREPISLVVRADHALAASGGPAPLDQVARSALVVCRASKDEESEVLRPLAARGLAAQQEVTVDSPQTVVSVARAGAGVGILNAVALHALDLSGLAVVEIDDPALVREVAAYWSDVLLQSDAGRRLHRAVLEAPIPVGAELPGPDPRVDEDHADQGDVPRGPVREGHLGRPGGGGSTRALGRSLPRR